MAVLGGWYLGVGSAVGAYALYRLRGLGWWRWGLAVGVVWTWPAVVVFHAWHSYLRRGGEP